MAKISKEQAARIWRVVEYYRQQCKILTAYRLLRILRMPLSTMKELEELVYMGFFGPVYRGPSKTVDELRRRARSTECYATHRAFFGHRGRYYCIKERPAVRPIYNRSCLV